MELVNNKQGVKDCEKETLGIDQVKLLMETLIYMDINNSNYTQVRGCGGGLSCTGHVVPFLGFRL